MSLAADYRSLWDAKLASHKWILCADVAAALAADIETMTEVGAPRPLLIAGSEGTGDLPDPEHCELIVLGTSADTMLGGIRAYLEALRDLPANAIAAIDAWDPDHTALVMPAFLDTRPTVAGRRSWGGRPEEWLALDDKMVIDSVWDAAGLHRAPSRVVANDPGALARASADLDVGSGVVWTADNREGWHGGGQYSRFVADPSNAAEALAFMTHRAHRVRVMPFLEGVPCAIHGVVFPEHVATFRPVELVVFRRPGGEFAYASCSTSWDPPGEDRTAMRDIARRVGDHIRDSHDFRGAFTVDGVLTSDGFLPTELNPRYGAGVGVLARAAGIPLLGISRMLIEGEHDGLQGTEVEHLVTSGADTHRALGGFITVAMSIAQTEELRVRWTGSTVEEANEDQANATLTRGPATHGGLVRFVLDENAVPPGRLAAPIVAEGFRFADRHWGMQIGELIPAQPAA